MGLVISGQPDDGVIQSAYVVKDIHEAMDRWVQDLRVGPWFLIEHFKGVDASYRGRPSEADSAIAMSFAGHMMIELIQQYNDAPSVYRETIEKRGYGFHHWGVATSNFERDVEDYRSRGYEQAFFARVPSGGRVSYMDTTAHLDGMVEFIELGASFDPIFGRFYRATIGWDGKDPVRSFL
jgi:Glyoxalase/Bleomycin resistance protein/Dioxygenase superfamily